MLRRGLGHSHPKEVGRPDEGAITARLCTHSPTAGMGHIVHQARAPRGMRNMMSKAHQTIQTKMMEKLALPTGVPKRPVRMTRVKIKRFGKMRANGKARWVSRGFTRGRRRRSNRRSSGGA